MITKLNDLATRIYFIIPGLNTKPRLDGTLCVNSTYLIQELDKLKHFKNVPRGLQQPKLQSTLININRKMAHRSGIVWSSLVLTFWLNSGLIVMLAGNYIPEVHYVQAPLYLYYNSTLIDKSTKRIKNIYFDKTFPNEFDLIGNVTYMIRNPFPDPTIKPEIRSMPPEPTPVPLFYNPYIESKAKSEDVIDWEDWNR